MLTAAFFGSVSVSWLLVGEETSKNNRVSTARVILTIYESKVAYQELWLGPEKDKWSQSLHKKIEPDHVFNKMTLGLLVLDGFLYLVG